MAGKCPKCEQLLTDVSLELVDINGPDGRSWKGVAYLCRFCLTILSVGMDPLALKFDTVTDTVNQTVAALKKTR